MRVPKLPPLVSTVTSNYQVILDATWNIPTAANPVQKPPIPHIPRARFINIDTACNTLSTLPHMLPTPHQFSKIMSSLGVKRDDNILVYDQGMFSAPRVYWMLKVFGHDNVSVLDGGLHLYLKNSNPTATEFDEIEQTEYPVVEMDKDKVIDYIGVMQLISEFQNEFNLVDARSAGRFAGHLPEPRPIPSGHAPMAVNVPFGKLLTSDFTFLPRSELVKVFEEHGVDLKRPVVNMCGSGVTACVVDLAMELVGVEKKRVYDGSWSEYAANPRSPIVVYPG
jgi:thiosulfate/3-mercaptopyruvate sulfurtransferase